MQEKLRKRLSRNFKNKELVPEQARERSSDKYWSPSPRIKILDGTSLVDGRLCPLARTSSMRHGPPKTISGQFHASLLSLVDRLEVTIRCLKSNGEKVRITTLYWCLLGYFVQCISQSPTPKLPYPQIVLPNFPLSPKKLLSSPPLLYSFPNSSFKLLLQTPPQNSSLQSPPQNASLQSPPPNFSPKANFSP